jgi:hypothetical protein
MLKVSPRGKLEGLRELSAQEGRALREGFGRWHELRARPLVRPLCRRINIRGLASGFLCD